MSAKQLNRETITNEYKIISYSIINVSSALHGDVLTGHRGIISENYPKSPPKYSNAIFYISVGDPP